MILDAPETIARWRAAGWWGDVTIDDMFRACVSARAEQLALADAPDRDEFAFGGPKRLTFAQADALVDRLASALYDHGLRKDDVAVVLLPNIVEIVLFFLATARLGAIASPLLLAYGERDLARIVRHLRPRVGLAINAFKDEQPARSLASAIAQTPELGSSVLGLGPATRDAPGLDSIDDITALPDPSPDYLDYAGQIEVSGDDIVTMHWTSGTTGDPKCVPRSHNNWRPTGGCCVDSGGLEPGERLLAPMQMAHTAGYNGLFLPWLETQGLLALHHPFDMKIFLDQIEEHEINHTVAAPAMLNAMLKENTLDGRDVSSVRSFLCGSAPLDPWMIDGYRERYGIEVVNAFGSTEGMTFMSSPAVTSDSYRRARLFPRFNAMRAAGRDVDAAGVRIGAALETRLVDIETGEQITEPKRPGELVFQSPALFPGYWTAEHELDRSEFDADGYFRSGEIFEIAGDGEDFFFFRYVDRLKDVINRGGVKIPVGELEAAIQDHPAVAEAVAIGYPDERLGERICAVAALRPGAALTLPELIEALSAAGTPKYMLPERLEIVDALPRNPTGKPLKRVLSEQFRTRASQSQA